MIKLMKTLTNYCKVQAQFFSSAWWTSIQGVQQCDLYTHTHTHTDTNRHTHMKKWQANGLRDQRIDGWMDTPSDSDVRTFSNKAKSWPIDASSELPIVAQSYPNFPSVAQTCLRSYYDFPSYFTFLATFTSLKKKGYRMTVRPTDGHILI